MRPKEERWTKRVYVAGPYRGDCEYRVKQNIRAAEDVGIKLWYYGFVAIIPHMNTAFFGGAYNIPDEIWLKGDLIILEVCDILVVLPGWQQSGGTQREIERAKELGIPIYYWTNEQDKLALCYYYEED